MYSPLEPIPAVPASTENWLDGRIAPNEKDEARLPGMAMLLRIAALAPAGDIDFQSVEIVDMRLSIASLHLLLFSVDLARLNLSHAAMQSATKRRGKMTAAATPPLEGPFFVASLLTSVMPESVVPVEVVAEPLYVAVKTGPAGSGFIATGVPDSMMVNCMFSLAEPFHQLGWRVAV